MVKEIPLTQGKTALVDDDDYDRVARFKWCARRERSGIWYAARGFRVNGRTITVRLHRYLLDAQPGELVDHANGNGLDCRRSNLRSATSQQNARNRKRRSDARNPYKGIRRDPRNSQYYAVIGIDGKDHYIGSFAHPEDAARAYDRKAREVFGAFARVNFPGEC